jgi:uncharacterized SAM-binding protein YcdF (DUF218 family)
MYRFASQPAFRQCSRPPSLRSARFFGILTRKERWGLSFRGWMVAAAFTLLVLYLTIMGVHPFLAVTQSVDSKALVVEGWVHEFAIRAGAEEFKAGSYTRVFTAGGPVTRSGDYSSDYDTSAHVGASRLKAAGVPSDFVEMVPSRVTERDRTYSSAVALCECFRARHLSVPSINVVTEGTHARRTRLLFQEAFGKSFRVGIIAVPNPDYDARRWWRYSERVREMVGEAIAYLYAKLFFYPSGTNNQMPARDTRSKTI